jgi:orotidine-5'-phosphate decarboxylase
MGENDRGVAAIQMNFTQQGQFARIQSHASRFVTPGLGPGEAQAAHAEGTATRLDAVRERTPIYQPGAVWAVRGRRAGLPQQGQVTHGVAVRSRFLIKRGF